MCGRWCAFYKRRPVKPSPACRRALRSRQGGIEVVALVVDHDEGREIDDLDAPDRFHPELGIFDEFDLADAILGEPRRRPADRAEIKSAVLLAGVAHFGTAVAF